METLTKYLGIIVCMLCLSGNSFAAASSSVQIDTTIPAADGLLTADQIPPFVLPKTDGAAPTAKPAEAPAAGAPATAH
ncbi:MAG: hypothetical protein V4501_11570 [Pseudomonadota bacterium]